jgi:hypothetical protein
LSVFVLLSLLPAAWLKRRQNELYRRPEQQRHIPGEYAIGVTAGTDVASHRR